MKHNVLCKDIYIRDCVAIHEMAKYFYRNPKIPDIVDNIPRPIALYLEERGYLYRSSESWETDESFYKGGIHEIILFYWKVYKIGTNEA